MSPSEFPQYHPDYGVDGQYHPDYHVDGPQQRRTTHPAGQTDRCQCGGIRYWHATLIGGGCEDCPCPEFKAAR